MGMDPKQLEQMVVQVAEPARKQSNSSCIFYQNLINQSYKLPKQA